MASGRKSLSDFLGHSWSSWSENAGSLLSPDEDAEVSNENPSKSSEVMQLFSSDMEKFGLFPETDVFYAVVCNECGAVVKAQGLLTHMRIQHKGLLQNKVPSEKLKKHIDSKINDIKQTDSQYSESSASIGGNDKSTAKYMLNEKLISKLALNEKIAHKVVHSEKLSGSSSDKHLKVMEKFGTKHSSNDKPFSKAIEKVNLKSNEKSVKLANEKIKLPVEKTSPSVISDKNVLRAEVDKSLKAGNDAFLKQVELCSSKTEKVSKVNEKLSVKGSDKYIPKFVSLENKVIGSKVSEKLIVKGGEKLSAKSILNEKILLKVAANDKFASVNCKSKTSDGVKMEIAAKVEKSATRPLMKSLLKEKILKGDAVQNIVPGSSLLKPSSDREAVSHGCSLLNNTSLSPPILTPQNKPLELHQLATDMPILSRKRKYKEKKILPTEYDPDRHCGVWCDYFNKFCVRSLTCKAHSVASRRAVVGRSKPFDQLLVEYRRAKEDQRLAKDDQDDTSEPSPQLSERVESSSEPSNSPFVGSPYASPIGSPTPNLVQGTTLSTPSLLTTPPIPSLSYQYPPYPPPLPASPSLPDNTVMLSPHLSSPLLNMTLPGLSPSHGSHPPESSNDFTSGYFGKAKIARAAAREINRLQLNKGRQFNVKHGAFPPRPLRTCLFQGRKSSGMFVTQRELEAMRSGFRSSIAEANKSAHLPLASQSPAHLSMDNSTSHISIHNSCDSSAPNQSPNSSQANSTPGLKSVLGTLCAAKTVINPGDIQQRVSRTQKFTILVLTE